MPIYHLADSDPPAYASRWLYAIDQASKNLTGVLFDLGRTLALLKVAPRGETLEQHESSMTWRIHPRCR